MKINTVIIKNFRSYKGITEFDFSFNKNKNIILIGGENGAGKSSIFEAMKICLYGPLTYKYQGIVSNYVSKIKNMINEDAFTNQGIESFIELNIDMTNKGVEDNYSIRRQWSFDGPKLIEEFIVIENGRLLNNIESNDFYEFFKSTIPPSIFDLSFFDGEKLFDFFEDRISGDKLKDTMLTLNNFDILNVLSRELILNTRKKNRERKNLGNEIEELEDIEGNLDLKKKELKDINRDLSVITSEIDKLTADINNKNKEFINAGGLNQEEREKSIQSISRSESERERINLEIKSFSNDILPFLMISNQLKKIEKQLYEEQDFIAYETIKDRVDIEKIKVNLKEKNIISDNLTQLVEEITNFIIPNNFDSDFKPLHFMSKEQTNKVISKINEIQSVCVSDITFFEDITQLTQNIAFNKKKLRNSMDVSEEEKYISTIASMNKDLNKTYMMREKQEALKEQLNKEILLEEKKLIKVNERIDSIKKAENIKDISDTIVEMTEELLISLTSSKRENVCKYFNEIFSEIMRKNKFIDYIDINDKFEVSLYVKKNFSVKDIKQIILNLGMIELKEKLGYKFILELSNSESIVNKKDLLNQLSIFDDNKVLKLSTKIDIMNLSSGEKQIYILCLYWALIKSSNITIPFIIDTPYARIDEKHRNAITTKFLPNISHQVIVLSTNTEIDEKLYKQIRDFVSREYTLEYDIKTRSTLVNKGYFYEVI